MASTAVFQAALDAWNDCRPQGYVLDARVLHGSLRMISKKLPSRPPDAEERQLLELFVFERPQKPPLFMQLVKIDNGVVHFLTFWRAFSTAAKMAGCPPEDGLMDELATLRDALLRHIEEEGRTSSSSSAPAAEKDGILRREALLAEVSRQSAMSVQPRFWQGIAKMVVEHLDADYVGLELTTTILLQWLHDAVLWEQEVNPDSSGSSPANSRDPEGPVLQVFVHIYDVSQQESIQRINRIFANQLSPVKFGGVFHAGVEVNGLEWSFGYCLNEHRYGVSCVRPKTHPQHHYRQTVQLKSTKWSAESIADIISQMIEEYPGDDYDLLQRNCCHFADDFCRRLGVGGIPSWIHRLARLGASVERMIQAAPEPIRNRILGYDD